MSRPRILIVEDDYAIRVGLSEKLQIEGYDVTSAAESLVLIQFVEMSFVFFI